jgi:hypothetical protein
LQNWTAFLVLGLKKSQLAVQNLFGEQLCLTKIFRFSYLVIVSLLDMTILLYVYYFIYCINI